MGLSFLRSGFAPVEQTEQEQPAEEAANMGLPRNPAFLTGDPHRADAENKR
jgi:hypothetical protein